MDNGVLAGIIVLLCIVIPCVIFCLLGKYCQHYQYIDEPQNNNIAPISTYPEAIQTQCFHSYQHDTVIQPIMKNDKPKEQAQEMMVIKIDDRPIR